MKYPARVVQNIVNNVSTTLFRHALFSFWILLGIKTGILFIPLSVIYLLLPVSINYLIILLANFELGLVVAMVGVPFIDIPFLFLFHFYLQLSRRKPISLQTFFEAFVVTLIGGGVAFFVIAASLTFLIKLSDFSPFFETAATFYND